MYAIQSVYILFISYEHGKQGYFGKCSNLLAYYVCNMVWHNKSGKYGNTWTFYVWSTDLEHCIPIQEQIALSAIFLE